MKHIWSVLCSRSSIDVERNTLSLFDCLEEISLVIDLSKSEGSDKISIPIEFQIVSFWTLEDSTKEHVLESKIELIDPDGNILNTAEGVVNVKKGASRFRNRAIFNGLPVTSEGRYFFRLWQKNNGKKGYSLITELPLDVKKSYKILETDSIKKPKQ